MRRALKKRLDQKRATKCNVIRKLIICLSVLAFEPNEYLLPLMVPPSNRHRYHCTASPTTTTTTTQYFAHQLEK
jgi:hypothetical protein